ncbi:MAG: dipeptide epimerase, partial [Cyanobacteria bacterium]|nr:dipeptide epimerase [Cyanobacteriota bacterium]
MHLKHTLLELPLEFPFTISRSSKDVAHTVLLEVTTSYQGKSYTGLGEAVPSRFYKEDPNTVIHFFETLEVEGLLQGLDPFNTQDLDDRLSGFKLNMSAKAAIDSCVMDIQGKILNLPLYQIWGLDPNRAPKTSYTLGIADLETLEKKTKIALSRGYDILKIKLGGPQDKESLALIRSLAPDATLRVDANAAWSLAEALELLPQLAAYGVEFVEEPLNFKTSSDEDYFRLKEETPLPLMADESCLTLRDIPRCALFFHAINLKPTKTGGLRE